MAAEGIDRLVRPELAALGGYTAHKSPDTLGGIPAESIIKLDANENPYGCSPRVRQALAEYGRWHIYPDAGQYHIRQQLGKYTGVDAGCIVAANGSGELLDYIMCLFLQPGDEVINCVPTFDMYRFRTLINRGRLANVSRDEAFGVNVKAVKAAITPKTKLIILADPNNPVGNVMPRADILELVATGVPLVIDEAYYEFYGETVAPLVGQYRNLMVLRTCSKWAALAGLRIGYGIFPPQIAALLMKTKLPYNVNVAALVAVQATLEDIDYLKKGIKAITAERKRLFGKLQQLEWLKPYPSEANFIFCSLLRGRAETLHRKMQERGILLRYFAQPRLENGIRISVGKPEHTDALMKALCELEGEIDG
ncbi:MAG: histidinol-phosphate transaminase [Chloroflexota bacterium]